MKETAILREIETCMWHYGFYVIPSTSKEFPLIDRFKFHGVIWRCNTGAMRVGARFIRFGVSGLPDFQGWRFNDGARIAIEAKTEDGKLNDNQARHFILSQSTGCLTMVVRSYDDCAAQLKKYGYSLRGNDESIQKAGSKH